MKCLTFQVPSGLPRQKLIHWILRSYPDIPPHVIRDAFAKRDVKINGIRCGRDADALPGAEISLYYPEKQENPVPILYRDEHMLILHKPGGIPCETNLPGERTLIQLLQEQLSLPTPPLAAHRLDALTEGLMVFALDAPFQAALQDAFRCGQIQKEYIALVKGTPTPPHSFLHAYLRKDALHGRVSISLKPSGASKEIITEYFVESSGPVSRLRIALHTGRTHQIRAHMAFMGHPVLGDDLYGDRAFNKAMHCRRLALCSVCLHFRTEGILSYMNGQRFTTQPHF